MREQYARTAVGVHGRAREQYLAALFGDAPDGTHIELRYRTQAGMGRAFFPVCDTAAAAAEIARHAAQTDVYVGVLPRARQASRRTDLAGSGGVVWVDCDTPESTDALATFVPEPSLLIASGTGGNRHAYWLLSDLISIDKIEAVNRRLAVILGADVCCAEANRVLRPPSRNYKTTPPADVSLLRCDEDARYCLDDIVSDSASAAVIDVGRPRRPVLRAADSDPLLRIEPARYIELLTGVRVPAHGKIACPFHDLSVAHRPSSQKLNSGISCGRVVERTTTPPDPLRLIPPPLYFERLTGLRAGRSGKLHCLFHDDRSPSLHVYQEPDRGWYCFGCARGGSIYDLAALLWLTGQSPGQPLRGADFRSVRDRLLAIFKIES